MRGITLAFCVLVCACDMDPPQIETFSPADHEEMRGVGYVNVEVVYSDDSDVTVKLVADGVEVDQLAPSCSGETCTADAIWDNTGLPAGEHTLGVVLEDSHGNVSHEDRALVLQDVLDITSMKVTNIVDDYGGLEMEVYAFADDTGSSLIGCAGSRQSLDLVDVADVRYQTDAILIEPNSDILAADDMGARRYRLEVWEDDDAPVCPVVPDPAGNDFLGASPAYTVEEWRQMHTASFGQVSELGVEWSRPLHTGQKPGTDNPSGDFDPNWGGSGGCNTGGSSGAGLLVVVIAVLVSRRRFANC